LLHLIKDRFVWQDPGALIDGDLELVLMVRSEPDLLRGWAPAYHFDMRHAETGQLLGGISFRVGRSEHLRLYAGHLGYGVSPQYRGHRYAARSCRLLLPLARAHGFTHLWITCNPDNYASRRTCELAGAAYVDTVDVPKTDSVYGPGEEVKCRYRLDL
jgi:tagatose 1,6-diphosphate aldolase